jgi:membrane protein DedA with SNARE-associated domain
VATTCLLALLIVTSWDSVEQMTGYGYFGGFVVSALGAATLLVPVPMLAVQFTLGGLLPPWFGPSILAPIFVGLVCSFGEALGALTIYATGYSGGQPLANARPGRRPGRIQRWYQSLLRLVEKRGGLILFVLSAVMNPFFYLTGLACGATRFGLRRFFMIEFAGKFIKCTAIAYAGYFGVKGVFHALGIQI